MPKLRTAVLAGVASLAFAGAAVAATAGLHTMTVDLPDGSVAHVTYAGDVPPRIAIEPVDVRAVAYDPFLAMDREFVRVSALLAQQRQDMVRQAAAMQQQAVVGSVPAGSSYSYTMVSTSSGKGACTQTVEWRSTGAGQAPQVTRASSGDCGAARSGEGDKPVPVSAPAKPAPVDPRSI